ncbi:restriction endonuclease subunit S [Neisseria polysaccharea]|uniref:restriction endonuclease subunit S n=1 Tax=Neisseria polysaccharea TaxID=489 RepID=UPI00272B2E9E|nr:restriction endonuclease subunit S [Neisseria polysaccharea]
MDMQSKAKKLIKMIQTAPVEWKPLGEVGLLVRGNGLQKKDFTESGVPAIHYGQIYTYYGNQTDKTLSFVSPELAEKLKKVDKGDVVITNTSENIEDVGKALLYLGEEQAVTGGHATIFKPSKEIVGKFFVYFTQTEIFDKAKRKFAKGTKVIDVSATDMAKIQIPIPPLETQKKIVKILDKFTELEATLEATLEAELALRKRQYRYYRDFLLDFDNQIGGGIADGYKDRLKDVVWKTLGEVVNIKNGKDWKNLSSGDIPVYGSGGVMGCVDTFAYDKPSVLIPRKGSITNIFYVDFPFWNVDTIYYTEIDTSKLKPKFFYYFMRTIDLMALDTGSGRPSLTQTILNKIKIPIPPLPEQEKIVAILDKFDTLTHSISEGLPYEIALRRKQYEYYRGQLLSFPKAA